VEQENPNSGGDLYQFALFIQLIPRAVRRSDIQLAVCPRGYEDIIVGLSST
jgi:hypothetical protein